ncbi:cell division control protein 14 [Tulasnella sp. JGI-2019a]|nr:cell division control protein 14 [Tulasnella sp. JGI-2019a]KAG9016946.1 cell division control protein 14 [Tulasnella sp. JGI-2019a]KAG9040158.1 cell division control protein 14 [Tulasnella sp. JGI-2019a]
MLRLVVEATLWARFPPYYARNITPNVCAAPPKFYYWCPSMAPSCEPLVQFSDRLYFTTFPQPTPLPQTLNNAKIPIRPKIRSKTRYHGQTPTSDENATYYWFTIDDDLPYLSFFEDWGPLNLGQVYKACILIHELLEDKELKPHRLVLYSSSDPRRKANAALLMALFVQIVQRRQPWEAFHPIAEMEFMPFRDAGRGRSDFNLSIQDCLYGFWKATQYGLCDLNEFSLEDYEYYEKVENGDWNWITPHFIAFASPVDTVWMRNGGPSAATNGNSRAGSSQPQSRGQTPGGTQSNGLSSSGSTSSLQKKLPTPFLNCLEYFNERGIKSVVRLNNPLYDKNTFIEKGFEHIELYFDDGTNPTDEIVRKFLDLSDKTIESGGVVAVHCKAGLGRTGTLIGAYLIYKYGFTANEAIAFMRIVRPGCVVGPQQQYMYTRQLEWAKWAAVDEYRRTEEADRAVTRLGATTPPDDMDELAIGVSAGRSTTPSTPKASTRQLKPLPVTPPRQVGDTVGPAPAAVGPLDIAQDGPPPGQPRKTPRAKRIATAMDIELDPLESQHLNLDLGVAKAAAAAASSASEDEENEEKKIEAEEAKDELCALQNTAPPPASPVKGGVAGTRGRIAAPKQLRPVPATERAVRTTRATTRNAAATTAARTAVVVPAATGTAAALRAKGAASVAKAKLASGSGAGAATTSNPQAGTSYKIPRLAANTPTATASASRMRPPSAMGTRRAARPVSPSPSGSPRPIQSSRLPVPTSLIPSKRGYGGASPHLPNGGGPIHSFSETSTATLQLPLGKKKKGRRGSAGSVGSVVSTATTNAGITGGDSALLDPDAWMSGEAAGAVVDKQGKTERPLLRNVRKRRSSFSAADVII